MCRKKRHPEKHAAAYKALRKRYRAKCKRKVLDHYGHQCVYCGATNDLQLDHVNGGGEEDRVQNGYRASSTDMYRKAIANNFPTYLQVTCKTCNLAKGDRTDADFRYWLAACSHHLDIRTTAGV